MDETIEYEEAIFFLSDKNIYKILSLTQFKDIKDEELSNLLKQYSNEQLIIDLVEQLLEKPEIEEEFGYKIMNMPTRNVFVDIAQNLDWNIVIAIIIYDRSKIFIRYIEELLNNKKLYSTSSNKSILHEMLAQNRVEEVFKLLREITQNNQDENFKAVILLSSFWTKIKHRSRIGSLPFEEINYHEQDIKEKLLDIINNIQIED